MVETIHVIRKRIVENSYVGDAPEDHAKTQRKIHAITEDFLDVICKMSEDGQFASKANIVWQTTTTLSWQRLEDSGILRSTRTPHKYLYKGLGHADFEHAFIALSYDVPEFYSTDRSFEDLNGDPDFAGVHFNIVRPSRDSN